MQDRIQQLKLGVDWHADHFRVVRMCDGQSPQPAQRFTPAGFLPFVQKQLTLADQVFVVYEAGPGGFHLHRQLTALGVRAFLVHPVIPAAAAMSMLRQADVPDRPAAARPDGLADAVKHGRDDTVRQSGE